VHEPVRLTHGGSTDRALALVYWPTTGQGDPRTEIGLDLVADILGDRLLREVREREGATYSPEAHSDMSLALPGYGRIGAALDVAAGDAPRLGRLIGEVAAGMRAGGITPDEFDRALQPRLARAKQALQDNAYWLQGVLLRAQRFPQVLDNARSLVADHEGQTLASVQALATRYLDPARALTVLVLPAAAVEDAASGAGIGGPAPAVVR
jgi:zinc protease